VVVDAELRGCPIDPGQLVELLTAVTTGRRPQLPDQAVCLECKRRGITCVVVARGEPCLGPVTQTGCGAICPGIGRGCYGCFGPREGANVDGLANWFTDGPALGGLAAPDVGRLFAGFTGAAAPFRAVTDRLGGRPPVPLKPATAYPPELAEHAPPRWGSEKGVGDA
jgi:sulfhydrogenase subunit delta